MTILDAIDTLDLRLRWADACWTLECRALKALGAGATIAEAAAAAWKEVANYAQAVEALPDAALRRPHLRRRDLLRAFRAACAELGADVPAA